jgi:Mg2+-importing ATPase
LSVTTAAVVALTFAIPYVPGAELLGFVPLPPALLAAVVGITVLYVVATELLKAAFFRN